MMKKHTYPLFTPSGCLSREALKKAAAEQLNPDDKKQISLHLQNCDLCSEALAGIKLMESPDRIDKAIASMRKSIISTEVPHTKKYSAKEINTFIVAAAASIILLIGIGLLLNKWGSPIDKLPLVAQHISTEAKLIPPQPTGKRKMLTNNNNPFVFSESEDQQIISEDKTKTNNLSKNVAQEHQTPGKSKTIQSFYSEKKTAINKGDKKNVTDIASVLPIEIYYAGIEVIARNEHTLAEQLPDISDNKEETTVDKNPPEHFFSSFDVMATFKGGDKKFKAWLSKNINYPGQASANKIQGTVYISFIIEADGRISNVLLRRGIGGGCDEESLRVISQMPSWNPALKNGEAVRVLMFMPIRFQLN